MTGSTCKVDPVIWTCKISLLPSAKKDLQLVVGAIQLQIYCLVSR